MTYFPVDVNQPKINDMLNIVSFIYGNTLYIPVFFGSSFLWIYTLKYGRIFYGYKVTRSYFPWLYIKYGRIAISYI